MEPTFVVNVVDHRTVPNGLTQGNFQVKYRGQFCARAMLHIRKVRGVSSFYWTSAEVCVALKETSGSGRLQGRRRGTWWRRYFQGRRQGWSHSPATAKTRAPLSSNRELIAHWLNDEKALNAEVLRERTALYDALQSTGGPTTPIWTRRLYLPHYRWWGQREQYPPVEGCRRHYSTQVFVCLRCCSRNIATLLAFNLMLPKISQGWVRTQADLWSHWISNTVSSYSARRLSKI